MELKNSFCLERRGDLAYLTIPAFTDTGLVRHAFTTRRGGVSQPPYATLNLGLHVGDDPAAVLTNRQRVCHLLGTDIASLVAVQQVHGNRVVTVDDTWPAGTGQAPVEGLIPADALVTRRPGVLLSSYYADCVPLFFLDPVRRVVALAHAGWRGTVAGIAAATVARMQEQCQCRAADLLVGIGPAIGPCCYEVDARVQRAVQAVCPPGWPAPCRPGRPGRWWLDLPELNRLLLIETGVQAEHITKAGYCTACSRDMFFSYRAQGGQTGRMASLIMLAGR